MKCSSSAKARGSAVPSAIIQQPQTPNWQQNCTKNLRTRTVLSTGKNINTEGTHKTKPDTYEGKIVQLPKDKMNEFNFKLFDFNLCFPQ
jgi:hypothetical protein